MKVLVTGGAGYVGSVLVGRLLDRSFHVTVLDSLMYGQSGLLQYCTNRKFDFVRGDVRDENVVRSLLRNVDVIIPLAAVVGQKASERDPFLTRQVNLDAIRMLDKLRSRQQRVVFPNTNSGYGATTGQLHCTEDTELAPISLYGQTKVEAEKLLLASGNAVTLRLATVFGVSPRMRLDLLVNDFVYRATTDGTLVIYEKDFKRNYLHIEDAADCFIYCIDQYDHMKGQTFNIGLNEANLSKGELAERIKRHIPKLYIHYAEVGSDPDKRNYIVSNAKINAAGFTATHSLDEGIRELIVACRILKPSPQWFNA